MGKAIFALSNVCLGFQHQFKIIPLYGYIGGKQYQLNTLSGYVESYGGLTVVKALRCAPLLGKFASRGVGVASGIDINQYVVDIGNSDATSLASSTGDRNAFVAV